MRLRSRTPEWAISERLAHPPLVTEEQFVAVQAIHTAPAPADGSTRDYALTGLVYCGICARAMDTHWANRRPGYRCRHGCNSARSRATTRPKTLYVREDHLIAHIPHDRRLRDGASAFTEPDPATVYDYLQINGMIIVCDQDTSTLETEAEIIPLTPLRNVLCATAKVPIQRNGEQHKIEQTSTFYGELMCPNKYMVKMTADLQLV